MDWKAFYEVLQTEHQLTELNVAFAEMLVRRGWVKEEDAAVFLPLAALAHRAVSLGHSCLNLAQWRMVGKNGRMCCLPVRECEGVLRKYPGIVSWNPVEGLPRLPLVYCSGEHLLYLHRYRLAELEIVADIQRLKGRPAPDAVPEQAVRDASRYYALRPWAEDLQQQAVSLVLQRNFAILTGGPGTGKTTTLGAILLLELRRNPSMRMILAAPTGKAAGRIRESIKEELEKGSLQATQEEQMQLEKIPSLTMHSLLGITENTPRGKYHAENPLPYDFIVLDESSMASLLLMHVLLAAIPENGRLLLVGDRNQLSSVEAGTVLGDLCGCRMLQPDIATLRQNRRAQNNPEMEEFTRALMQDDFPVVEAAVEKMYADGAPKRFAARELSWGSCCTWGKRRKMLVGQLESLLQQMLAVDGQGGKGLSLEEWQGRLPNLERAMEYVRNFRILTAEHSGLLGERNMNAMMAELLHKEEYDDGAPIMILQNDRNTGLMNGDVGVCWQKKIHFPQPDGRMRSFAPVQLPPHELVYAMTIHKSQGSGFDNVLMILPEHFGPILTRELLYTGITRTKRQCRIWGNQQVFLQALQTPVKRWSGMQTLLR